jgi:CRP-like cAMP-binding protein
MGIMLSPETLRRFPIFAGIGNATLKALAMAGEEITLNKGDWLFHESDKADYLYLILSGAVDLKIALDAKGAYHADLTTLVEGDLVGWSALVEPYIYKLGAVAAKDSRLAKWNGACVCELMARDPEAGYKLMSRMTQIVGSRLTAMCVRFASLVEGGQWQRIADRRSSKLPTN